MDQMAEYRATIDQIDTLIIDLLAKRFDVVDQISTYKKENNLPALDKSRFEQMLADRQNMAQNLGLDTDMIAKIWDIIHEYSLLSQKK